jgi:hypothetical protein
LHPFEADVRQDLDVLLDGQELQSILCIGFGRKFTDKT